MVQTNEKVLPFYGKDLSSYKRDSELRLFYVGVSRAKDNLTISYVSDGKWQYPSQFIDIISDENQSTSDYLELFG